MPRIRAARPSDDEDDLPAPRRSARCPQPRVRFDGMVDLAKISNAELAGHKRRKLASGTGSGNRKGLAKSIERSTSPVEEEIFTGRRSGRTRKPAARASGCVDLAKIPTKIIPYDGPKARNTRQPKKAIVADRPKFMVVLDTDSPDEELSSEHQKYVPQRVPLRAISNNFSAFTEYAPMKGDSESSEGSEYLSPSRRRSSPPGKLSSEASAKHSPPTTSRIHNRRNTCRELGDREKSPENQPLLQDDVNNESDFADSALTDLRNVETPASPNTQHSQRYLGFEDEVNNDDFADSALTDLRNVETPAFPETQHSQKDMELDDGDFIGDFALTDLRGIDTPGFPHSKHNETNLGLEEDVGGGSTLIDLRDIETPAFPCMQRSQRNFGLHDEDVGESVSTDLRFVHTPPGYPFTQQSLVQQGENNVESALVDLEDLDTSQFQHTQHSTCQDEAIVNPHIVSEVHSQRNLRSSQGDGASTTSNLEPTPFFQIGADSVDDWSRFETPNILVSQSDPSHPTPSEVTFGNGRSSKGQSPGPTDAPRQQSRELPRGPRMLADKKHQDATQDLSRTSQYGVDDGLVVHDSIEHTSENVPIPHLSDASALKQESSRSSVLPKPLGIKAEACEAACGAAGETEQDSLMPGVPLYLAPNLDDDLSDPAIPGSWPVPSSTQSTCSGGDTFPATPNGNATPFYPSESVGDTDMRAMIANIVSRVEMDDGLEYESSSQSTSCEDVIG